MSRKKTEYLQAGGAEQGMVYIQGETVKKVDHFKYVGVVASTDESCEEEVRRRMQAGWQVGGEYPEYSVTESCQQD